MNTDVVSAIRDWLEYTRDVGSPDNFSVTRVRRRASDLIRTLRTSDFVSSLQTQLPDDEMPDVLHAIIEVFGNNWNCPSRQALKDLENLYELVVGCEWPDEFGERAEMLADLSFLAWNQSRLLLDGASTGSWQSRCARHALSQEHVRNFIAVPFSERSPELNERFLSDYAVVLACLDALERERNRHPPNTVREGSHLHDWLDNRISASTADDEMVHFLAANAALSVVIAQYHLSNVDGVERWREITERHISRCQGGLPLQAGLEHNRLSFLYDKYRSSVESAHSCAGLVQRFEALGMLKAAIRTEHLQGLMLKDIGRMDEAFRHLEHVHARARACGETMVAGLSIAACAQILGDEGRFKEALASAREALSLAKESDSGFVMAYAQGTIAELLRDQGDLASSIEAYELSVRSYEEMGMEALAAYIRVLFAETLLLAGRSADAASVILVALPIIERHRLTCEAVVAIGILREATKRQQPDPIALRQLREQLDQMHREHKL